MQCDIGRGGQAEVEGARVGHQVQLAPRESGVLARPVRLLVPQLIALVSPAEDVASARRPLMIITGAFSPMSALRTRFFASGGHVWAAQVRDDIIINGDNPGLFHAVTVKQTALARSTDRPGAASAAVIALRNSPAGARLAELPSLSLIIIMNSGSTLVGAAVERRAPQPGNLQFKSGPLKRNCTTSGTWPFEPNPKYH